MRLLSPILSRIAYPALEKAGYFPRWHAQANHGQLTVVTYHGVVPKDYEAQDPLLDGNLVTGQEFRAQLELLSSRYRVISPGEFLQCLVEKSPFPANSILLTCDDGLL